MKKLIPVISCMCLAVLLATQAFGFGLGTHNLDAGVHHNKRIIDEEAVPFTPNTLSPLFYAQGDNDETSISSYPNQSTQAGLWPDLAQSTTVNQPSLSGGVLSFAGVENTDEEFMNDESVNTSSNGTSQSLPDASGGDTGEGFSSTGLDYDPTTGYWIVGNDGRGDQSGDPMLQSIVILSFDGTTIIDEFVLGLGTTVSIQGVAYDSTRDKIWAITTEATRRCISVNKSTGDIDDDASFNVDSDANGLAYDPNNDYLMVLNTGDGEVKRYNAATGAYVDSLPTDMAGGNLDMLDYDADNEILWYSRGANGSDGVIRPYSINRDVLGDEVTMTGSISIEGIHFIDGKAYVINNAYFHEGVSGGNALWSYDLDRTQQNARLADAYEELEIALVVKLDGTPNETDVIYAVGNPLTGQGVSLYTAGTATDTLRVILHNGTSSETISGDFTLDTALTTESILNLKFDFSNKTVTLLQDGVEQDGGAKSYTLAMTSLYYDTHVIAAENDGGNRYLNGSYRDVFVKGALLTEAENNQLGNYWANEFSLTWNDITEPTIPDAVDDLAAGSVGSTSAPVTFSAPDDGGSSITDYILQISSTSASSGFTTFADGTSATTGGTYTGLTSETQYWARVAAVNSVGQSDWSNVITFTTAEPFDIADLDLDFYFRDDEPTTLFEDDAGTDQAEANDNVANQADVEGNKTMTQTTDANRTVTGTRSINGRNAKDYGHDGVDDYYETDIDFDDYTYSNGNTLFGIVQPDSLPGGSYLIDTSNGSTGFGVRLSGGTDDFTILFYEDTLGSQVQASIGSLTVDVASIWMLEWDTSGWRFYQDGTLVHTQSFVGAALEPSAETAVIGAEFDGTDVFDGLQPVLGYKNTVFDTATKNNIFTQLGNEFDINVSTLN